MEEEEEEGSIARHDITAPIETDTGVPEAKAKAKRGAKDVAGAEVIRSNRSLMISSEMI